MICSIVSEQEKVDYAHSKSCHGPPFGLPYNWIPIVAENSTKWSKTKRHIKILDPYPFSSKQLDPQTRYTEKARKEIFFLQFLLEPCSQPLAQSYI